MTSRSQNSSVLDLLADSAELHRAADSLIRGIYTGKTAWSARSSALQAKLRAAYATANASEGTAYAWHRLINHLGYDTPLLSIEPAVTYLGPQPGNCAIDALMRLTLRQNHWIRAVETWLPEEASAVAQIGSLARHLLSRYDVPRFLDAAWFSGGTAEGELQRDWFQHIGGGQNIRRDSLPIPLTEHGVHYFLQAPADSSVIGAFRYGQILGLGGDAELARAVAQTRFGQILPDEPFWLTVLHFFVNQTGMGYDSIGPIVDFIYEQKFGDWPPPENLTQPLMDAPEPEFSMKGRTLRALLRRVEQWHDELVRESKRPRSSWDPSGIPCFAVEERDPYGMLNSWMIQELLNSNSLREEGREMRNCVFTYAGGCLNGSTSIWSVRVRAQSDSRYRRLLTVELNLHRRAIVQVKGRCNRTVASSAGKGRLHEAASMLRRWANEQHITVACNL